MVHSKGLFLLEPDLDPDSEMFCEHEAWVLTDSYSICSMSQTNSI